MKDRTATVYVIDDDASVRASLGRLLKLEGFKTPMFGSAEEFLKIKSYDRPACLVSDIQMPGVSGLQLQDIFVEKGISLPIIFITGHGEIPMTVQAMKKGAVDFLPKPYGRDELLRAVNQAVEKDRESAGRESAAGRIQHRFDKLTDREKEVLEGVLAGMLNKQIGYKLGITEKTVKVHRASVITKVKATSIPHLVRMAELAGLPIPVKQS